MKKYYCIAIMIIFLMCPVFQVAAAEADIFEDTQIEVAECILWGVGVGIAGAALFTIIEVKKHKPVAKAMNADYYVKADEAKMRVTQDNYIRSTEVKTKVPTANKNS